jgi:glucose-1-phosphate thymidylyltransferase
VPDPERFGVAIFDEDGEIVDIVEKPVDPPSAVAIGGIYLYDEKFWDIMDEEYKEIGSSFTITDVNRHYLRNGLVKLVNIDEYQWLDCGTPDALLQASVLAEKGILSPEPCNIREGDSTL